MRGGCWSDARRRAGEVRIEVWDTGPGIPMDQRQAIFGEFYRLKGADRDAKPGLGLGLAIVDRLCCLLGHAITLRSEVGKGSCFAVAVPLIEPARVTSLPAPIVGAPSLPKGKLVVVIDDAPLVMDGMSGLLRSWGCEVLAAEVDGAVWTGLLDRQRPPGFDRLGLSSGGRKASYRCYRRDAFAARLGGLWRLRHNTGKFGENVWISRHAGPAARGSGDFRYVSLRSTRLLAFAVNKRFATMVRLSGTQKVSLHRAWCNRDDSAKPD